MTRMAGTVLLLFTTVAFAEPPIKPTLVSWEGKEAPAIEVIDSMAKQAGIAIDRSSIPKERIVKQVHSNKPFWDVLTAITKEAGCKIVVQGSGERLKIVPVEKTLMPPVSSSGTFLVTAKSLTAKFDYETGKSTHEAAIEINWEPRQKVFRVGPVKANANFTYCTLNDERYKLPP